MLKNPPSLPRAAPPPMSKDENNPLLVSSPGLSSSPLSPPSSPPPLSSKPSLISQHFSGIDEPENMENLDDNFILSVLDPYDNRILVWAARLLLFWGVFVVCGFYITFGAEQKAELWAIGVGAALSYLLCIGTYLLESFVIVPFWYRNDIGRPMVHWLSWAVFLDIIYHAVKPANQIDYRQELAGQVPVLSEEEEQGEGFWLDFVADVGDGFNPTYAVFSTMARAELAITPECKLPRANSIIIGGDLCYPWPRYDDILSRFLRPVSWAYPEDMADQRRNVYVMPGNHEWADGLRNFRGMILDRTNIGAWTIKNKTPYFAVKLPHGWWMFCVDPGNEKYQDMDPIQLAYFAQVVEEETRADDRFILCVHEPDWIKNSVHGFALFKQLAHFRANVLGERLRLTLAGDLHYYRRMEELNPNSAPTQRLPETAFPSYVSSRRQLVVAGHGGAFSHPTYAPEGTIRTLRLGEPHLTNGAEYQTVCNHPTPQASRATYRRLWASGFDFGKNYGFGSILGLIYLGMTLAISPLDYQERGREEFPNGTQVLANSSYLARMAMSFWFYPSLLFLVVMLLVIGTTSQALESKSIIAQTLGAVFAHIATHVLAVFALRKLVDATLAELFTTGGAMLTFGNITAFCFVANTAMYILGFFLGPMLSSIHLYLNQEVFQVAYNEPMCSIEYQEDKGFVRMKLRADGEIDLYSIGIRQVPRKWQARPDSQRTNDFPSHFECSRTSAKDVARIEPFVVEHVRIARNDADGGLSAI